MVTTGDRLSLWALASLVVGALPCPPLCLIAPVLGVAGLVECRIRPHTRGRGLAITGICLGVLASGAWLGAGLWWHANVRRPLLEGPVAALQAGHAGDIAAFTAEFTGPGDTDAARQFLATLEARYGRFETVRQNEQADQADSTLDRTRPTIPYELVYTMQTVPADAVFVIRQDGKLVLRFERLVVHDAVLGDLAYPSSSEPAASNSTQMP